MQRLDAIGDAGVFRILRDGGPAFDAVTPALCLVVTALGMVQRDGLLVAAGIAGTVLLTVSLGYFAQWIAGLLPDILAPWRADPTS